MADAAASRPGASSETRRLAAAFLGAVLLHGAAFVAIASWRRTEPPAAPGEQEIAIDLAPALQAADTIGPAEVAQPLLAPAEAAAAKPAPVVDTEPVPPEPVTEPPAGAAHAEPPSPLPVIAETMPARSRAPSDTAALVKPQETVTAPPPPEPAPTPRSRPQPPKPKSRPREPRPELPRAAPSRSASSADPRQGRPSSSRENAGGAAAAADPNLQNRYAAQISAAVRGRLRYPVAAQSQGIAGVATVRFTLHRSGEVLSASLVRSAGHPALDRAALATVNPGSSLPPAPDGLPQQQITFVVPLKFTVQ
jgi:periplasmic protein TonB